MMICAGQPASCLPNSGNPAARRPRSAVVPARCDQRSWPRSPASPHGLLQHAAARATFRWWTCAFSALVIAGRNGLIPGVMIRLTSAGEDHAVAVQVDAARVAQQVQRIVRVHRRFESALSKRFSRFANVPDAMRRPGADGRRRAGAPAQPAPRCRRSGRQSSRSPASGPAPPASFRSPSASTGGP